MLSRHKKHPVPAVMEWGKAAALRGTLFEGCGSNDLSSLRGLQWRRTLALWCCFQIRPASGTDAKGGGGGGHHRLRVTLVTLEDRDRTGSLTGLVEGEDVEGSPIARWWPDTHHHVGLWFPAAEGWLSAWQSRVLLQPVTVIVPGSEHFLVHCLMLLLIWWQGVPHSCRKGCVVAFHK